MNKIYLLLAAVALAGCNAEERKAPKDPLTPVQLQNFALGDPGLGDLNDQVLFNNKLFLWNDPPSAAVAEQVIRSGN